MYKLLSRQWTVLYWADNSRNRLLSNGRLLSTTTNTVCITLPVYPSYCIYLWWLKFPLRKKYIFLKPTIQRLSVTSLLPPQSISMAPYAKRRRVGVSKTTLVDNDDERIYPADPLASLNRTVRDQWNGFCEIESEPVRWSLQPNGGGDIFIYFRPDIIYISQPYAYAFAGPV